MFARQLQAGTLTRPLATEVAAGRYWLTWLRGKPLTLAMAQVRAWLMEGASGLPD
ncbi:hypothetical protein [Paracoccus liaowanqingii]|uniref:hypothetical protein n=1 Tax=Paracoccus liaowanqingii TaxID=2560053 RepID=UPI00143CD182|nr:hypothetical protein [Paracoccus liaowanqingii]